MLPTLSKEFYSHLEKNLPDWQVTYTNAHPYPNIVLDNFLPPVLLEEVLKEFPDPSSELWHRFDDIKEIKLGSSKMGAIPDFTRHLLLELNGGPFLEFLEKLTGIHPLIADNKMYGGGIHQIQRGGKLSIHADFNKHMDNLLDRRLNLLIYLNQNWKEEYGGHFEMWSKDMTVCEKKVLPIFNRCVVFSTTSTSYHGHPEPLACPEGWTRKSIALYYYSNGRPEREIENINHSTLFRERPGENLELLTEVPELPIPVAVETVSNEVPVSPPASFLSKVLYYTVISIKAILPPIIYNCFRVVYRCVLKHDG